MKKILLVLTMLLLFPVFAYGWGLYGQVVAAQNAGGGEPAGETYDLFYNADHPTDTDTAWTDAGEGADKAGTVAGSTTFPDCDGVDGPGTDSSDGGNCIKITGGNMHVRWTISSSDILDSSEGSFTAEMWITDDGTDGACPVFEGYGQTFYARVTNSRTFEIVHGTGTITSANSVPEGEWVVLKGAWNTAGNVRGSGAGNELAIKVGSNAWEYDTDDISAFGSEPTMVIHGENDSGNPNDTYYMDGFKTWVSDDET